LSLVALLSRSPLHEVLDWSVGDLSLEVCHLYTQIGMTKAQLHDIEFNKGLAVPVILLNAV